MFTVTKAVEEVLLRHFIQTKLDIAYAIIKPFPFFEALRDHCFITEKMYKESLEACQNLVPISRVVHNVLTNLEQTFHPSLLLTLFSQVNLREYPSLGEIFRSFKNAACNNLTATTDEEADSERTCSTSSDTGQASSMDPQRNDKDDSPEIPNSLPGPKPVIKGSFTSKVKEKEDSGGPPGSPGAVQAAKNDSLARNDLEVAQEAPSSPAKQKEDSPAPDDLEMPLEATSASAKQKKDSPAPNDLEMAQEETSAPAKQKEDSPAPDDLGMAQEATSTPAKQKAKKRKRDIWSIPKRRRPKKRPTQGVASPGQGVQKKLKVVDQRTQRKNDSTRNLKMVTRSQKARTRRSDIQSTG
ncbi:sp110 nuclear body protein isoform X4 [Arvicola amphibius]|uniref:sp110 nuclear body protein isoform X4 n=1 Tax=Arvicola amphibius TaxID=1047088 RepID=UPI0018E3AA7E|nr:sp110 nuclear body protein isoform X4 [Arvicola amphibius]